jgi:hypothetical protein
MQQCAQPQQHVPLQQYAPPQQPTTVPRHVTAVHLFESNALNNNNLLTSGPSHWREVGAMLLDNERQGIAPHECTWSAVSWEDALRVLSKQDFCVHYLNQARFATTNSEWIACFVYRYSITQLTCSSLSQTCLFLLFPVGSSRTPSDPQYRDSYPSAIALL